MKNDAVITVLVKLLHKQNIVEKDLDIIRSNIDFFRREGLSPWLYEHLQERSNVLSVGDITAKFRKNFLYANASWIFKSISLKEALRELSAHGIKTILLKGAYLGKFIYGNPALRTMADFDLLVAESNFEKSCQLLKNLGYSPPSPQPAIESELKFPQSYSNEVYIDLHQLIQSVDSYFISFDYCLMHSFADDFEGTPVHYLSRELNLIHCILHHLAHEGGIRNCIDLSLMLLDPQLDWKRLEILAGELGVIRPIYWVLKEIKDEWQCLIPIGFENALSRHSPSWIEDRILISRIRYMWRLYARLQRFGTWNSKLQYLLSKTAPTGVETGNQRWSAIKTNWNLFVHLWKTKRN